MLDWTELTKEWDNSLHTWIADGEFNVMVKCQKSFSELCEQRVLVKSLYVDFFKVLEIEIFYFYSNFFIKFYFEIIY